MRLPCAESVDQQLSNHFCFSQAAFLMGHDNIVKRFACLRWKSDWLTVQMALQLDIDLVTRFHGSPLHFRKDKSMGCDIHDSFKIANKNGGGDPLAPKSPEAIWARSRQSPMPDNCQIESGLSKLVALATPP
jgi:hypothetical protein